MEWKKNKYLLAPLLIACLVFALDKMFLIPAVQDEIVLWKKIEPVFYASRYSLLEQLKADYPERKKRGERLAVILGSSRAGEFSAQYFQQKMPGVYIYNFSAPIAPPAFQYYWLTKILEAGINIDFVIVEFDPVLFSQESLAFSLTYSFDPLFVLRNVDWRSSDEKPSIQENAFWNPGRSGGFSYEEAETYFLKRAFALYRYPVDFTVIAANHRTITLTDPKAGTQRIRALEMKKSVLEILSHANQDNLGGISNFFSTAVPEEQMEIEARAKASRYLKARPSMTGSFFFRQTIRTISAKKIRAIVYWPVSSRHLRTEMENFEQEISNSENSDSINYLRIYQDAARRIIREENTGKSLIYFSDPYIDPAFTCRSFEDSMHLSGHCFGPLTDYLTEIFTRMQTASGAP